MKVEIKVKKEVEVKTLKVKAGVRHWEDSEINGITDTSGELVPCRDNDYWCPLIDIETGIITNWQQGVKALIHYKVVDDGTYTLLDSENVEILKKEGYVPCFMSPSEPNYGDYIIMEIDEKGHILDWNFNKQDVKQFKKD